MSKKERLQQKNYQKNIVKKVFFYNCDITNEDAVVNIKDEIIKTHSKIDILINNAAIDPKVKSGTKKELSRLENFSLDKWNLEIFVGLTGAFICSKVIGSEMAERGEGVIVNIASDLGLISPDQNLYKKRWYSRPRANLCKTSNIFCNKAWNYWFNKIFSHLLGR